jgi:hypothetical protein
MNRREEMAQCRETGDIPIVATNIHSILDAIMIRTSLVSTHEITVHQRTHRTTADEICTGN